MLTVNLLVLMCILTFDLWVAYSHVEFREMGLWGPQVLFCQCVLAAEESVSGCQMVFGNTERLMNSHPSINISAFSQQTIWAAGSAQICSGSGEKEKWAFFSKTPSSSEVDGGYHSCWRMRYPSTRVKVSSSKLEVTILCPAKWF